ncbi:hypothetical protein FMEXI_6540 [Fusarium mexicanum]|uniref:Ankyrin n=1 Tax=Fusarium mexicanum TaxID=751941 RepID=A0A8H5IX17_9HYPO|nr:hypothetical protein FMEXI_6540 [Fusarium mexicanum]
MHHQPERASELYMAELLGIVAGGAGLASLALQLVDGGQKLRQHYKNVKGLGCNISWLSEDIELISKQLIQLEASADDIMQEQLGPIMMGRCRERSARVADRLANLAGDVPVTSSRRQIIRITFRSGQWKDELDDLQALVTSLKQDISHLYTSSVDSFTTLGCDFKNVVPAWDTWMVPYIFEPDPFEFQFLRFILKNNPDFGDSPPLHASILFESDSNFKLCLSRTARPFEKTVNVFGQSALHIGVCQASRVAQLLAAGHQVDPSDKRGVTPLMYAAAMNNSQTVMMLVKNGAKLRGTGENNFTVLDLVARRGNWDLLWEIIDYATAAYPGFIPELFRSLLSNLDSVNYDYCYAAHDTNGQKGCFKFWSRVTFYLGSPDFSFHDGTTLMHMTHDSRSARVLIQLGFTKFKQDSGSLLEHLASLHDLSLFDFAVANGGDAHLHNDCSWDILSVVLAGLTTHSPQGFLEVLRTLEFLLDRGVQVLSRDGCVCDCSTGGCIPGLCSLPITSNLRLFAWLELLEKKRKTEEAKEFSLALLRQMSFDWAGLHHTCGIAYDSDFSSDIDNDRFWDVSEQIGIENLNEDMELLASKAYSELKIEVMIRLRRVWGKERGEQWPGPRLAPSSIQIIRNNREKYLKDLMGVIRNSKQPKIPEPFSSSWDCVVQKRLDSYHWTLYHDLELAVVDFGVGLYRCGGDQFVSWIPLLTQLTDVLLAEEEE